MENIQDISIYFTVLFGAVFLFSLFFNRIRAFPVEFRKNERLLSRAEERFYRHLVRVAAEDYFIATKVRVADVISHRCRDRRTWFREFGKMAQKHFDFVLFDPSTMEIKCALELDDASHQREKRKRRDSYLNELCSKAGLRLIRVKASSHYKEAETRGLLEESSNENSESVA